ncbi:YbaK/EbsC family protein [Halomarina ordinaria]|uniref:YbaK/EbsC family protein n=1 Tax=Halomarina ordinaria TaxID=3033939 RepID=A0ABD5UAT1_9EURY|nr:YbaK/EbsC family protein [Halomarina sp. PSRA2]
MHQRAQEFSARARDEYDFDPSVTEFPEGTRTAADAAAAVGCDVAHIASSIALRAADDLVVCVTSGANRVDMTKVAGVHGVAPDAVEMADPTAVRETLGWSIGGVPPFCHDRAVPVYLDETLTEYETVWAAAGTPEAVFPIDPDRLRELAGATVVDLREE